MADTEIAKTILQQLGGGSFVLMTGARNLIAHERGLSFKLPGSRGFTKHGINYVCVHLTPADLYEIEFCRIRNQTNTLIEARDDVYVEDLRAVFSDVTGLAVQMPRLVQA